MEDTGEKVIHKDLSYKIVGILFDVYNDLGYGFQEKYYERALDKYFRINKIVFKRQAPYDIAIKGETIAKQYIDFIIDEKIVLEIKKGDYFSRQNMEQVKAYLKVTGLKLAILANFTSKGIKYIRVLNPKNLKSIS